MKIQSIFLILALVFVSIPVKANTVYFVDSDVVGYRCTDWSFTVRCKEFEIIGYSLEDNTYYFEKDLGFTNVTEFRAARNSSTKGLCRTSIGYPQKGWWGSKLFKAAVDKVFLKSKMLGPDGSQVIVDYVEFRCYKA